MVDGSDSKLGGFGMRGQEGSQDGVIGHVQEGHHGVPAFVIVPHLTMEGTLQWQQTYTDVYLQTFPASNHLYVEFALHISQKRADFSQCKS